MIALVANVYENIPRRDDYFTIKVFFALAATHCFYIACCEEIGQRLLSLGQSAISRTVLASIGQYWLSPTCSLCCHGW